MSSKILQVGAEAVISLEGNKIIKNRIKKSYRIPIMDEKLRKSRTKSEAKIIEKLKNIISVPEILKTDNKKEIIMEYIEGKKLSDNLENLDYKKICRQIGETIAKLHNKNIIHGDLTTSNMIYVEGLDEKNKDNIHSSKAPHFQAKKEFSIADNISNNKNNSKVYLIDFGLAFHSKKIEDKAVDLHLIQQALEAKHFTIWKECFEIILDNYNPEKRGEILKRIKVIESRGRYKDKY